MFKLLELFWSFFQVGLFSFGGGMASLPLIKHQVVDTKGWLSLSEFTDLITIAEMTPGPIAINSSTFVGIRIAGLPGAIVATFGCILPSCIIVLILAILYFKFQKLGAIQSMLDGLRPAVVSLIASAGLSILIVALWGNNGFSLNINSLDIIAVVLFASSLFVLKKWKPSPIFVMLGCGVVGSVAYLLT